MGGYGVIVCAAANKKISFILSFNIRQYSPTSPAQVYEWGD